MPNTRSPEVVRQGQVVVVVLGSEYENLDEGGVREVREVVLDQIAKSEPPLVVVDLSKTTFFGSSFLEVLFRAHSKMKERNGRFAICGLNEYCSEVIEVTHLDRLIEIFADVPAAVEGLEQDQADA